MIRLLRNLALLAVPLVVGCGGPAVPPKGGVSVDSPEGQKLLNGGERPSVPPKTAAH